MGGSIYKIYNMPPSRFLPVMNTEKIESGFDFSVVEKAFLDDPSYPCHAIR
jgi:hypothetical protein